MIRKYLLPFLLILASLFPSKTLADITYWEPQIKYAGQFFVEVNNQEQHNLDEYMSNNQEGDFMKLFDYNDNTRWDSNVIRKAGYTQNSFCVDLNEPLNNGDQFWFMVGSPNNFDQGHLPTEFKIEGKGDNGDWFIIADSWKLCEGIAGYAYRSYNRPIQVSQTVKKLRFTRIDNNAGQGIQMSRFQIYKGKSVEGNPLNYKIFPNEEAANVETSSSQTVDKALDGDYYTYMDTPNERNHGDGDDSFNIKLNVSELSGKKVLRIQISTPFDNTIETDGSGNIVRNYDGPEKGVIRRLNIQYYSNGYNYIGTYRFDRPNMGEDEVFYLPIKYQNGNPIDEYRFYIETDGGDYKNNYGKGAARIANIIVTVLDDFPDNMSLSDIDNYYNKDYEHLTLTHTHGFPENKYGGINIADGGFMQGANNGMFWKDGEFDYTNYENNKGIDSGSLMEGFKEHGLTMTDFSFVNTYNPDPKVGIEEINGDRQRTYTVVHELSAFPGERVDLYPFSDIHLSNYYGDSEERTQYQEDYVRWYDYKTDKRCDCLYFFQDPRYVAKTEFGHIGGLDLLGMRSPITVASLVLPTDQNIDELWIAADFSMQFDYRKNERIGGYSDENGKPTMLEPTVVYRHVFHVKSAITAAEELNGSGKNQEYAKAHRRFLSARAGEKFTIRLDRPMPDPNQMGTSENIGTSRSEFIYKGNQGGITINGTKYGRVRGYSIRTVKFDGGYDPNNIPSDIGSAADSKIFEPYIRSNYTTMRSMIEKDKLSEFSGEDTRWVNDNLMFYRAIKCEAENAKEGTYLVRIAGMDGYGNILNENGEIYTEGQNPLILQEYVVTFLPSERASFMTETEYNRMTGGSNGQAMRYAHETHREDYLEGLNGRKIVVDFDEYNYLDDPRFVHSDNGTVYYGDFVDTQHNNFTVDNSGTTFNQVGRFVKLPIPFEKGNYGYSYNIAGDYNMQRIVDHSSSAVFRRGATKLRTEGTISDKFLNGQTQGGVYDRLFYNTNGDERGFMYYVNAASDPGEIVRIDIDELCAGTTVYVSAWVNEFTDNEPETANVIFNFNAVVDGVSYPLHGFTSGYVKRTSIPGDTFAATGQFPEQSGGTYGDENRGEQGQWMHVYYSFVPDLSNIGVDIDGKAISYELVLENNCISSKGADYAIDDVRVYLVPPRVEASQLYPLCNANDPKVDVKIQMPFEPLLQNTGREEAKYDASNNIGGEWVPMQYAILDKKKYDESLATKHDYVEAFVDAVLHYPHRHVLSDDEHYDTDSKKDLSWGTIQFNTAYSGDANGNYTNLPCRSESGEDGTLGEYINDNFETKGKAMWETIHGERNIVFISSPNNFKDLQTRDFIIVIGNFDSKGIFETGVNNATAYTAEKSKEYDRILAQNFDLGGKCVRMANFRLQGPAQIVVDGFYQTDADNIVCCENQRPVVQVDLYGRQKDANDNSGLEILDDPLTEKPYIDWYAGNYDEFLEEGIKQDGKIVKSLWAVLAALRTAYHNTDTWDVPAKGEYTETMRSYLKEMCATTKNVEGKPVIIDPKVVLYKSSYLFPQTHLDKGDVTKEVFVTAIPLQTGEEMENNYYLCTEPTEIKIKVANNSPSMLNGFNENMVYPENFDDVPLRIGLNQLAKTSYEVKVEGDEYNGNNYITSDNPRLYIPLRKVAPVTNGVMHLKKMDNDPYVYLVETDDPDCRSLGHSLAKISDDEPIKFGSIILPGKLEAENFSGLTMATQPESVRKQSDHIGNLQTGDMFTYNIYISRDGSYKLTARAARGDSGDGSYSILVDGNEVVSNAIIKGTANWGNYDINEFTIDYLSAGNHTLTLNITKAPFNLDYIDFKWTTEEYLPDFGLTVVGEVVDVKAPVSGDVPMANVAFYNNKFKFKEGFYYKFKFAFEEDFDRNEASFDYIEPCHGETVFTIKVVPEYQKWTGSEGVNWNNDANWSRVSSEELLVDGDVRKNDLGEYITDGSNLNAKSYAPLDFTKVIIPAGANYPQLAPRTQVRGGNDDNASKANTAQPISVNNGYGSGNQEFIWNGVSPKSVSPVEGNLQNESDGDGFAPTDNIQFDMAAVTYTGDGNVYCRPWYANAAAEVHFNTNAEILNQQHLDYQKAWVDMEMTPGRWYTAAMPLQRTFAGDMYAPTAGARQETELFTEIRFDNDGKLNDRFAPAVYQRGWDKGDETVYELPSTSNSETRPVAIAANWSHVYNDVAVAYEPGSGFSVKSDVSRIQGFGDDNYVKFRFPKADERYLYQEDGQLPSGEENGGTENIRDKRNNLSHRLVTLDGESKYSVTVKKADNGKFFLVGNPFMSHLDMAKFFEVNTGVAPKYWIMSGDSQLAAVMDKDSKGFYGKADEVTVRDFSTVPPMQGFFVEANNAATELTLTFTPEMMKVEAYSPTAVDGVSINRPLLTSTRSGDGEGNCYGDDVVTVSAGGSVALLRMNPDAAKGYDSCEDVEWLDDSNQRGVTRVYTVAGDMAVSINQTPDFEGIGIGVAAASEEEETELRFDGELIDGFKLLDTKTGEVSELQPGFTMTVEGSASGRFFLTRSSNVEPILDDAIKIYKESGDLVVKAPEMCGAVTVRIYDPTGRLVSTVVDSGAEIRVPLTAGIYIVEVRGSESGRKTAKLRF